MSTDSHRMQRNWRVAFAASVGMSLALSVYPPFLFGLFVKPLAAQFGWTRVDISLGVTLCNYVTLIASPFLGILIDRVGVRRLVLPSIVGMAAVMGLGAFIPDDIRYFYALHLLIPLLALGTLPHTYTRAVVGWFVEKRGLAVGVTVAGVGLGGMVYPQLVQHFMSSYGWRSGYLTISALVVLLALPIVVAFLREPPAQDSAGGTIASSGYTTREAVRRSAFWLLAAIMGCMGVVTTGITVHMAPLLSDRGLSLDHAARGVGLLALAVVVGRIGCGFVLDRLPPGGVAFAVLMASAAGLALLPHADDPLTLHAAIVMIGVGIGAEFDFLSFFIARWLGLRAYGSIYGWIYACFMLGCGLGPPIMGAAFDGAGTYAPALYVLACSAFVAATLFLLFRRPLGPEPVRIEPLAGETRTSPSARCGEA